MSIIKNYVFFVLLFCVLLIVFFFRDGNILLSAPVESYKSAELYQKELYQKELYHRIDTKVLYIFDILDSFSFEKQNLFFTKFTKVVKNKRKNQVKKSVLDAYLYIEKKFEQRQNFYIELHGKKNLSLHTMQRHYSLILHFIRGGKHGVTIEHYKKHIADTGSVFLFKRSQDLLRKDIQTITQALKKIHPSILIFIDQEGGWINRYIEFSQSKEVDEFFGNTSTEHNKINSKIRSLFPKYSGYYPSLKKIGKAYAGLATEDKKYFLEKLAYIRLQSLKNNGINTYGLVLDLDRGNPVISNYSRSFSGDVSAYRDLIDAFSIASKKTGVILYFKHFPGHGEGKVDTHKGVLNYLGKEKYLKENIEIFEYALKKNKNSGLMVAHMYIPIKLQKKFQKVLDSAHFLLTDDLGMQGYKSSHGKVKKDLFFTTDAILSSKKMIIVDTQHAVSIY